MTKEMEQQSVLAAAGSSSTEFMEETISQLKGRLEESLGRSHTPAYWKGMIEDCDIILEHLESGPH